MFVEKNLAHSKKIVTVSEYAIKTYIFRNLINLWIQKYAKQATQSLSELAYRS